MLQPIILETTLNFIFGLQLSSKWSPNGLLFTSKVVSIWSPMETFSSLPISSQPCKCFVILFNKFLISNLFYLNWCRRQRLYFYQSVDIIYNVYLSYTTHKIIIKIESEFSLDTSRKDPWIPKISGEK